MAFLSLESHFFYAKMVFSYPISHREAWIQRVVLRGFFLKLRQDNVSKFSKGLLPVFLLLSGNGKESPVKGDTIKTFIIYQRAQKRGVVFTTPLFV